MKAFQGVEWGIVLLLKLYQLPWNLVHQWNGSPLILSTNRIVLVLIFGRNPPGDPRF
uniref:Uncharacterized protein n=1 Tax=Anguilla anguilla TaxID=7936 RepID=A0A0E9VUK4_ANGAN